MTRLVIGLGNPGPEYEWTRHNVGFHVVDRVAQEAGVLFRSARLLDGYTGSTAFQVAQVPHEGGASWLMKPETFMNRSGDVVAPLARHLVELDPSLAAPPVPVPEDASEEERALIEARLPELDPARLLVV